MDALLHEGNLRVRIEPDDGFGDIREQIEGLPHEVRVFSEHNWWNGQRHHDREVGGPLIDEWVWMVRRARWRDNAGEFATKVFLRYVSLVCGGVAQVVGDRIFYLLPTDGEVTTPEVLGRQLDGGIKEILAWENGEVYGYVLERETAWAQVDDPETTRTTWEEIESCWGFVGYDWVVDNATEAFRYAR